MTIQRCMRCGVLWAHTCGPRERFDTITRICTNCIAACFPIVGEAL